MMSTMPEASVTTTVGDRTLSLSNLDKVLYPAVGYTKAEIISYYLGIADVMLRTLCAHVVPRLGWQKLSDPQRGSQ